VTFWLPSFSNEVSLPPVLEAFPSQGQSNSKESVNALRSRLDSQAEPEPADVLSGFIFNQTEYVYSFLSRIGEPGGEKALDQLPGVYQRCLESYETITNFLKRQGDSSPCTLFVQ